jgi:hypothetical protein
MNLITRGDWDGVVCAVLLKAASIVKTIQFAHPKDMQDGKVTTTPLDIIANLPYVSGCGVWFDHHISEEARLGEIPKIKGSYEMAPSAARLVYNYYLPENPHLIKYEELVEATDKIDSARLSVSDVLEPSSYVLLSFTIDPRTGLTEQWREYFHRMIELLRDYPPEDILKDKEVALRTGKVIRQQEACLLAFRRYSRREENMVITDFRDLSTIPTGNRFLVYTLYPGANVSIRIFWGRNKENVVVAVGHSIFNRTCDVDIGKLLKKFGGGGQIGTGTCQFSKETADDQITDILSRLRAK